MNKTAKFGLSTAYDLHEKLKYDAGLLLRNRKESAEEQRLEEFEAFNFFVTAWHLHHDWLKIGRLDIPKHALEKMQEAKAPFVEIKDVMRDIANGSKHFELNQPAKVAVGPREISSWYSWFFGPQFAIDTKSFHFLLYELVAVILAYFEWVFDDAKPIHLPAEVVDKLEKAREIRAGQRKTEPTKVNH